MKLTKKILTIFGISTMAVAVIILAGSIFGLESFEWPLLSVLLTFAIFAVASAFTISSLNAITKKKVVSIVCISLITLLSILGLVIVWMNFKTPDVFNKILLILAMATIFFNIIVALNLRLGKNYTILQIITYILVIIVDVILTIQICGVNVLGIKGIWQTFAVLCLGTFAMFCTLAILGKKFQNEVKSTATSVNKDQKQVVLKKEEYEKLLEKIKFLEDENSKLKEQLK